MPNDMSNLNALMKQAQEMQKKMQITQAKFESMEVEGIAVGGLAKVIMNCQHKVRKISISPDLLKESKDVLEGVIASATNDAVRKVEEKLKEEMVNLTKDFKLPKDAGNKDDDE